MTNVGQQVWIVGLEPSGIPIRTGTDQARGTIEQPNLTFYELVWHFSSPWGYYCLSLKFTKPMTAPAIQAKAAEKLIEVEIMGDIWTH
jgi:hypothetical protein